MSQDPLTKTRGYDDASRAALANMSPRGLRLDYLERWVNGTQYKGRPDWFTGGPAEVPLWEREPCIVYPMVSIAISSNVDLALGEGKFPSFTIAHTGSTTATEGDDKTDPVEACLKHIHRICRFPTVLKEAYRDGQGKGTAVAIYGVRDGKPTAELVPAKWCTRDVDEVGNVTKLVIEYPYLDEYQESDGCWAVRAMLYRREITDRRDVTFLPAIADPSGRKPTAWVEDKSKSVDHNLGFCPVVWYPFMKGCQPVNVIDGKAIHAGLTDEIQAHDIARSQWHRCALYSEPQKWETGVQPGSNPTGEGRTALVPSTEFGGPGSPDNPITGGYTDGMPTGARKMGPNWVWQFTNKDTKVGQLETPASALQAQWDNCSDLRMKIQEALCVVLLDPENIKFAATVSGKALEAIRQKQLDRVDEHRDDLRDGFIVPSITMQLRIAHKVGDGLKVPGVKEVIAALGSTFEPPDIETTWGGYFKPDPAEQAAIIAMVQAALSGSPLITKKIALEKIAPIFGITDIDALLLELEKAEAERAAKMATELQRLGINGQPGGVVPSNPGGVPAGRNRGRTQDGQDDAGEAGN